MSWGMPGPVETAKQSRDFGLYSLTPPEPTVGVVGSDNRLLRSDYRQGKEFGYG